MKTTASIQTWGTDIVLIAQYSTVQVNHKITVTKYIPLLVKITVLWYKKWVLNDGICVLGVNAAK